MTEKRIPVKVTLSPEVQDRLDAALLAAGEFTRTMEALRAENHVLRLQVESLQSRLRRLREYETAARRQRGVYDG